MLQFNLSKPDRVVLHKRIVSGEITPKEISLMSSTDLANEELKQSIKIAEKESLEHSILQKTKVPRAKITHKGLQDIEDMNGEVRAVEPELEIDQEEERRERERLSRLRAVQTQPQAGSTSVTTPGRVSVPPESPVVPSPSVWTESHAVPASATSVHHSPVSPVFDRPPANQLFVHTSQDYHMAEPELNLADLINIDEDSPVQDGSVSAVTAPSVMDDSPTTEAQSSNLPSSTPKSPTGISPFAASITKTEPSRSSFDLNSLWAAPKSDVSAVKPHPTEEPKQNFMDQEILGEEANDQDFDMFLEKEQDERGTAGASNTIDAQQAAFDGLPQVWTGMVYTHHVS
jgi:hypothetical protein